MLASPLKRASRIVNMSQLGHALTELDAPRVHALVVYNSNPAAIAPDQSQVLRGMARPDLFTVVHEQFFTDTADYADILLPATTFLEHKDMQGAYGHYYVQISNQAIEPLGEARSNVWLFSELAQRMGFTEACFRDTPDDLIAQALHEGGEQPVWMQGNDRAGSRRRWRSHPPEIRSPSLRAKGSCPSPTADSKRPAAKQSFIPKHSPPRASIRCPASCLQRNRATALKPTAMQSHIRSSSCRARPTTT